jgi:NADPH-dependent ferric siderophore reductase
MTTADRARPSARPRARTLQVLRTTELSPSMRRITLGGAELSGFPDGHAGPNVKVFVPRPDQQRPVLPELDHDTGRYRWPEPHERPTMRTYSVRRYDEGSAELDVDFVLHGKHGVASAWARQARPGDFLGVLGPGGKTCRSADWYLLAGDETALPAISALLERLPATARGQAFIEVAAAAEQQDIACPPGIRLTWLHRDGLPPGGAGLLSDAVRATELPHDQDVSAWVSGESAMVRDIRRHLRHDRGLDPNSVLAIGYWKRGMAEPDYHDQHNHDRE